MLEIDEVEMRVLRAARGADEMAGGMFVLEWEPVSLDRPAGAVGAVLVVGDPGAGDGLLTHRAVLA